MNKVNNDYFELYIKKTPTMKRWSQKLAEEIR